jgi:hypothetical protein
MKKQMISKEDAIGVKQGLYRWSSFELTSHSTCYSKVMWPQRHSEAGSVNFYTRHSNALYPFKLAWQPQHVVLLVWSGYGALSCWPDYWKK